MFISNYIKKKIYISTFILLDATVKLLNESDVLFSFLTAVNYNLDLIQFLTSLKAELKIYK